MLLGTKENNGGVEGAEVSLSVNATTLTGGGVVNIGEGEINKKTPKI